MSPYVCWPMLSRMAIFVESLIKIKSIYFHVNFWHNFFVNVTKLKLETCVSFPKIFFQKLCENKLTLFWPLWQWGWANGWTPWWYNLFKMAIPDLFIIVYVINFLIENFGNKIKIKNMTCFEMKTQIKSSFSRNLNINNKQRQIWISRARAPDTERNPGTGSEGTPPPGVSQAGINSRRSRHPPSVRLYNSSRHHATQGFR